MTNPLLDAIFDEVLRVDASDVYITCDMPPSIRVHDRILTLTQHPVMDEAHVRACIATLLPDWQRQEFEKKLEFNAAYYWQNKARFRVNAFFQQQLPGLVLRRVKTDIPTFESLSLPKAYSELAVEKRGLVLVVGATGSGKTTSMAAMIGHRNQRGTGHIITVEDPIEFVHSHAGCIVTQRDVGIDTHSFHDALKNALRQRPDVVLIGEIRDRQTMESALAFSETGHLCLATLHASSANQAIERVMHFFPEEMHRQILLGLSLNLRGVLSQRLVPTVRNGRIVAVEILRNEGLVRQLIEEGKIKDLKDLMERNVDIGMQTMDQALFSLFQRGEITEAVAIAESDNPANQRLRIRQSGGLPGIRSS